jgi:type I restriction enzyme M protein
MRFTNRAKIFDTTDFGYREIRVERPLRLNFQASPERLARLADQKPYAKLEDAEKAGIETALSGLGDTLFTNRTAFETALSKALKGAGLKVGAPIKKAILSALSERDEDWRDYVAREVKPFVPDAWVDESYVDARDKAVGRVGYEINFNRYFYRYVPPRPLEEIDAELKALEAEIAGLLKGVVG